MSHAGAQFGEIAQFLFWQVDLPEQRIGKDLVQFGKKTVLVGGGEIAQIEIIGLRQTEQYLRGHRALVPLYQVDIARGNPQPLGDLGLRQPQLLADAAESRADKQLFSSIGGHGSLGFCDRIDKVTYNRVQMLHDITIRNQAVYPKLGFSRLPLLTHSQCTVTNVDQRED